MKHGLSFAIVSIALAPLLGAQRSRPAAGVPGGTPPVELVRAPGDPLRQAAFDFAFLPISSVDHFGSALVSVGDLDGDGRADLVAGAPNEDLGTLRGSAWVLFLDAEGKVERWKHVAPPRPFEPGQSYADDHFGSALAALGDLDGDGRPELAVGAPAEAADARFGVGKIWILSLDPDGSVFDQHAITEGESGFAEDLEHTDLFGCSLEAIGDLDGDGVGELAVGASLDHVNGVRTGSVRILFLNPDATVRSVVTIAAGVGGFSGALDALDGFGASLAALGDLDGDGNVELAVGATGDDDTVTPNTNKGAVWILFLQANGSVGAHQKLSETAGGLGIALDSSAEFGAASDAFDLEGDGTRELLVGARHDRDFNLDTGAVWLLSLASDGTVLDRTELSQRNGGVSALRSNDQFGSAVCAGGDIDGDGLEDLFVGAPLRQATLCPDPGAVFRLLLDAAGEVADQHEVGGRCLAEENFAAGAVEIGDLTGDGRAELAVGAPGISTPNTESGSLWIFSPDEHGAYEPLTNFLPDTTSLVPSRFGWSVAAPGDIDNDGNPDLAVGADGRVYVFRLLPGGAVRSQRTFISGFNTFAFSSALVAIGDLDGDGRQELAAGAPDTSLSHWSFGGALVVLFLNADGTKRSGTLITTFQGGFTGYLPDHDHFGSALAGLGDLDGDGLREIAVGAPSRSGPGEYAPGSVWILSLSPGGTVVRELQLSYGLAGLDAPLEIGDRFGSGLLNVGDLDLDGVPELLVAAEGDDDGGPERGALWILFLRADGTVRATRKLSDSHGLGGHLQDGAELGRGMALLSTHSSLHEKTLFLGAPFDDRIARDAGRGWLLSLYAR